jgi:putative tryptophan/tyrosine transport system substrate-binding protein
MMLKKLGLVVPLTVALLTGSLVGAQQTTKIPRLCYLAPYPLAELPPVTATGLTAYDAFLRGLRDLGYVEGQSLTIDYLSADGQFARFPILANEFLRLQADMIVVGTTPAARAAKHATQTIPIVLFGIGDPVGTGLVASLARPGGNATGINFFSEERLELLRELVPAATRVAVLLNPANTGTTLGEVAAAAAGMGLKVQVSHAGTSREIDAAFAAFERERPDVLFVAGGPFLLSRRMQLALLAARHAMPAAYGSREYAEIGGLMSYGASLTDAHRQAGVYAGRVLKGAKPADLPVMQATKFELVINLPAARALGLEVPPTLLARADEVIE